MTFKKGETGNPNGRPLGSRHKLTEAFLADLHDAWATIGKATITQAAADDPIKFLQVVADLLPKEAKVDVSGTVTHKSEPVSELDGLLREAIATGQMGQNKEPLPN